MKTYKVTIDNDGIISWYNEQTELHNESGPAIVEPNGYTAYYRNGKLHNDNGPAIIYNDGYQSYYINDIELTKEQWTIKTSPTKDMTLSEVIKELGYNIKIIK